MTSATCSEDKVARGRHPRIGGCLLFPFDQVFLDREVVSVDGAVRPRAEVQSLGPTGSIADTRNPSADHLVGTQQDRQDSDRSAAASGIIATQLIAEDGAP